MLINLTGLEKYCLFKPFYDFREREGKDSKRVENVGRVENQKQGERIRQSEKGRRMADEERKKVLNQFCIFSATVP